MATTKIWPVRDSLKRVVDYASNPEKTSEDDLASVIRYAKRPQILQQDLKKHVM